MAPKSTNDLLYGDTAPSNTEGGDNYGFIDAVALTKANADTEMIKSEISKYAYTDKGGRMTDTQPFNAVFEQELNRVVRVVDYYQKDLEFSAKSLLTQAEVMLEQIPKRKDGHIMIHTVSQKMEDLVDSCLVLQNFVTKNRSGLLSVAQKADTQIKTRCAKLVDSALKTNLNSVLVIVASDIYAAIRIAEIKLNSSGTGDEEAVWEAPSSFQRTTTKYWVKEDQLTKLMLTCAGEAPLLVYGKKGTLTSKPDRVTRVSEGDKLWESMTTPITSVYFDSTDMGMYKKRLARLEGAQLLRARWYGNKMPKGDGIIFLELKTHHEKWVVNQSVKERAAVQEKDMSLFLQPTPWTPQQAQEMILRASPKLTGEELTKSANLLYRMHQLVVKYRLRSCVRSVYMRAAFQSAKSNDLRLTLDRNVTLVDETSRTYTPGKASWCLSDEEAKTSARAVTVPFNVFEIKLVGDNPMPAGLAALISGGVIEEAPKFSKFLTGGAAFNRVQTLPYWANHPSFASMFGFTQVSQQSVPEQPSLLDPCDCYYLFGGGGGGGDAHSGTSTGIRMRSVLQKFLDPTFDDASSVDTTKGNVDIAEKKPIRVEPKSFFANERTFIQWISAALLLLTVSTIMMGNGEYMRTAAMISFAALGLVSYATFVYFRRIKLLTSGKGYGYVDHIGPCILAVGVGIGVFIVFWDIMGATDILGQPKYDDDRRLGSFDPRRLLSSSTDRPTATATSMYESPGQCFRQPLAGINALTYEPHDVIVDHDKDSLLVASTTEIFAHPLGREEAFARRLVHLDNSELGGLTTVGERIFALSGGPQDTRLLELEWTPTGELETQGSWIVAQTPATEVNGLTFFPNNDHGQQHEEKQQGQLYMGINGLIYSYHVPNREDASLVRVDRINMNMIHRQGRVVVVGGGGSDNIPDKITSLQHLEGVLYLLHAKHGVLQAWDLQTGTFLAEIPLPRLDHALVEEWQGFALERRRPVAEKSNGTVATSLRGSNNNSNNNSNNDKTSSQLWLHLTVNTPPQIWSFAIQEEEDEGFPGRFAFAECAAAPRISSSSS